VSAQVISFGCRLNLAEAEGIRALLAEAEDLIVVNSCAVTAEASRQTRQAIRRVPILRLPVPPSYETRAFPVELTYMS